MTGPRRLSPKEFAEIFNNRHKYSDGGTAEFQITGFTEEEENLEIKQMFQDVWNAGYEHVHTLKIVPLDCGRPSYYVHRDSLNGE